MNAFVSTDAQRLIAQSYLDQSPKDYNQAYLNFDKLTTEEFRNNNDLRDEAMYKAAYCLKQLKVNDEALGRYAEFMTRFPDSKHITDAYFDLGKLYSDNENNYELARFNYNRALQSPESPNHSKAEIQLEIGGAYYNQGDFGKARNVFNLLLQEYPESEEALTARLLIASSYRREKRVDEAIRVYENMIANHAEGASLNRSFKSLISYTVDDGLRLQEGLPAMVYYEIGKALSEKKDFEKAFDSYARIVRKPRSEDKDFRKNPLAPFALHEAMVALRKLDRKDELETFATTYINAFGDINELPENELILSAEAQLKFADVLRKDSEEGGTLEDYNKAAAEYAKLENYPPKPYPRLNLIKLRGKYYEGLCYEKGTTPEKSIETYQEAIKLFESIFKPFVDNTNIDVPHGTKEVFDYCIQTALDYAKKIRTKLKVVDKKLGDETGKTGNSSNQDITAMALASTVFLNMNNGMSMGSGFFVGPGLIATNHHVVEGAVEGTARIVNTDMTYAIIGYTAVDPDRDLAILKVRTFDVKPLILGNSDAISKKTPIYVVGNPKGVEGTLSDGIISNIRPVRNILIDGKLVKRRLPYFQVTAPISPGNSGGPVLNRKGKVIGISVATFRDIFIRGGEVLDFTDRFPIVDEKGKKILGYYVDVPKRDAQNINYAIPVNDLKALLKRAGPLKPLSDLEVIN